MIYDGISGRRLSSVPLGTHAEQRYGAPYLTLHRADLHAGLRAVAQSLAPAVLRPGFELTAVDAQGGDVVARAVDGSEAKGASLIGADGLWSTVRSLIIPRRTCASPAPPPGARACRAEASPPPSMLPWSGSGLGRGAISCTTPSAAGKSSISSPSPKAVRNAKAGTRPAPSKLCSQASRVGLRIRNHCWNGRRAGGAGRSIASPPLRRFGAGRIALLGDAAHPVLPYLAQGAALAIEDAVTLAACIDASPGDPPFALRRYEGLRRPRVARVQRLSRRFGWLYHLGGPLRPARNFILERRSEETALRRFDWLYRTMDEPP